MSTDCNSVDTSLSLSSLSLDLKGTCYYTVGGGRRLMLTRLRPEPVLVPAFRGLLNRTYSARDTTITTSLILFTFTRANLRGTAFKINQLHLATIATLANISVDKLTRFCRGVNSVDTCIVCRSGSLALVIFGEPRWSGTTCEAARSIRVKASIHVLKQTQVVLTTCRV